MAVRLSGVWGIDLGQSALKAIRLEMKDGQVEATAFEYIEHPKILSQPDADPDELAREALNQFLSRNQIRGDVIAISVPGQSGLARFVKLPPVDEKKIADIVKFEAKQQIPFPLEEVVWDYQRLNKGDIVDGLALETEIGLFAMKRDMVIRSIAQFKAVNVEVHLVQMAPLALCNFIAYDLLGKAAGDLAEGARAHDCIVALEIGTDSSNLVITDGGRIIWQRPIPIGGNHFTRALTKEMKLTFAKAEHLKKNAAKSPELKKILSSLKQVLNDFVGEVQRSLGYFTNTHRNAQIQYMVGLGNAFRLPGLQKFLQEKLQLEVRKFQKLARATGESVTSAPTFAENIMTFGVAYGLALQGLKQAHLQTNLLPYEVRLERVIRGKKPWAVAAAACLIFGMCMLALAQGQEKRSVINDTNKKGESDLDLALKGANESNEAKKQKEAELEKYKKSLEKIGANANDRINWQLLHQYVNSSSPQPDGGRVALEGKGERIGAIKAKLWTEHAQWAFRLFEQKKVGELKDIPKEEAEKIDQFFKLNKIPINFRQPKDLSPADAEEVDRFIKQNLIQINIAGVNALYTEDLGPYFRLLHADGEQLRGMDATERKHITDFVGEQNSETRDKSPLFEKGKDGWVVEIRGYTYHKGGESFVKDTIIQNLKYPGQLEDKKDKEMIERIKQRVSYLHIYYGEKLLPGAGESKIAKSHLRRLVRGMAEGAPEGKNPGEGQFKLRPGPGNEREPGGNPAANQKVNRDGWNPIGETAVAVLVNEAGGAAGGPLGKGFPREKGTPLPGGETKTPAQDKAMERFEFVLVFVWREPTSLAKSNPANDKQTTP
jgi:type IV pilus assembly protein PilM